VNFPSKKENSNKTFSYKGKKQHLLQLFPLLCDYITVKESETKDLLKNLFLEIAKEIGLTFEI